ncbi:MAG: flippase-like domain-containing protein [Deltaproteobacteria bacterium]|nr:flippase-like domain-containing protein [Deltaproteobacteria bacterium]
MSRRHKFANAICVFISAVALLWIAQGIEGEEVFNQIKSVNAFNLVLALAFTSASYALRSWRWPFFFKYNPPSFSASFRCLNVGFFMNNILPARLGEIIRAHLGAKATKQTRTPVLATIAGERLADGVMISTIFSILFTIGANPAEIAQGREIYLVSYLFGVAALLTAILLVKSNLAYSLLDRLGRLFSGHLSSYTLVRARRFIDGLEPMRRPSRLTLIAISSLIVWLVELAAYYQVSAAFDMKMTVGALSLFLAAVNFSSLIPAAPGGIGVIEAFATLALVQIGISRETAFAMVASQHLIQFVVVGFPGLLFFLIQMKGHLPEDKDLESENELTDEGDSTQKSDNDTALNMSRVPPSEWHKKDKASDVKLSIVIPAYNEENRISKTLASIVEYFNGRDTIFEVLVVDDGSLDKTSERVREFEAKHKNIRLLTYPYNRGKGYAVRFGIYNSIGECVLYNDADGATPIKEIEKLEAAIKNGADIAIGSRALYSKDTSVKTVFYRKALGRIFNGLVNFIILPKIADTQCGFKLFSQEAARYAFSRARADRYSFDVEILFIARKGGFKIIEVPINWTNIPGSKVNLLVDSMAMLLDVLKFRFRDLIGIYDTSK